MKLIRLTAWQGTVCFLRSDMVMKIALFEPSEKYKSNNPGMPKLLTEVELCDEYTTSYYVLESPETVARLVEGT